MMMQLQFTYNPSPVFYTYQVHLKKIIKSGIFVHPGDWDAQIPVYQSFFENLFRLLNIPENYFMVMLNSAPDLKSILGEIFFKKGSIHLVHGKEGAGFTELLKFRGFSNEVINRRDEGSQDMAEWLDVNDPLYINLNEPDTGSFIDPAWLEGNISGRESRFTHLDYSSILPGVKIPWPLATSISFTLNGGFGIPSDGCIWLVRDTYFEEVKKNIVSQYGTYVKTINRSFLVTGNPDISVIKASDRIFQDMLGRGLKNILNDTIYKALSLYGSIGRNNKFTLLVKKESQRSPVTLVSGCKAGSEILNEYLLTNGIWAECISIGEGNSLLRISNYPVHSREQVEKLCDLLEGF